MLQKTFDFRGFKRTRKNEINQYFWGFDPVQNFILLDGTVEGNEKKYDFVYN
jgi:hypothetical protein